MCGLSMCPGSRQSPPWTSGQPPDPDPDLNPACADPRGHTPLMAPGLRRHEGAPKSLVVAAHLEAPSAGGLAIGPRCQGPASVSLGRADEAVSVHRQHEARGYGVGGWAGMLGTAHDEA